MDAVFALLNQLAERGVKLCAEGHSLNCYARKGVLTHEIRDNILRNKPEILKILGEGKSSWPAPPPWGTGAEALPNLAAEAVLARDIQPATVTSRSDAFASPNSILLTGASGFLGAYLLRDLLLETGAQAFCLIRCRSENEGAQRIKSNLLKYGLWSDRFQSRITIVPGDLSQLLLGIGEQAFEALCAQIDAVYHNGASVNFLYPYARLKEANVQGTKEVIRLACRLRSKPLHFVSTVGVFPPTKARGVRILESDLLGDGEGLVDGYRQSKWVAEKMVAIAGDRGLPIRIYRPGLVTGDTTTGIWNTDDFLPRMIKGCIQLGCVPDRDAVVDMVPVDYVSKAIVHLSRQQQLQFNVFHIVNPKNIPANELGHLIASLGYQAPVVPYAEWRNALLEDARISVRNALYPLLAMFSEDPPPDLVPPIDCSRTLEGLRGTQVVCPEINADLVATYLSYFKASGFLDS